MIGNFSWVLADKLAGSALPGHFQSQEQGVQFDLNQLYDLGVRCLVSLLETGSFFERLCRKAGLQWISFPIEDFNVPDDMNQFDKLIGTILSMIDVQPVCVHCYAGIGRTGLTLACCLGLYLSIDAEEAIRLVRRNRPAIETGEQEQFVHRFLIEHGRSARK